MRSLVRDNYDDWSVFIWILDHRSCKMSTRSYTYETINLKHNDWTFCGYKNIRRFETIPVSFLSRWIWLIFDFCSNVKCLFVHDKPQINTTIFSLKKDLFMHETWERFLAMQTSVAWNGYDDGFFKDFCLFLNIKKKLTLYPKALVTYLALQTDKVWAKSNLFDRGNDFFYFFLLTRSYP